MFAQLGHLLFQQHQCCPDALDLLVRHIAAVNPSNGLTLHQLAKQLDQGEHHAHHRDTDDGCC